MDLMCLFKFSLKCYDTGLTIRSIVKRRKFRKYLKLSKRNGELANYKKTDVLYVCANGPSLKKVNLDELEGDTIVINDFFRIADQFCKKPTYYLLLDNEYAWNSMQDRMDGVMNCHPEIPHIIAADIIGPVGERYKNSATNLFVYDAFGKTFNHNLKIDFTQTTYTVWNVVTKCIQLGIYLGYKEIRLLGFDYSLFASRIERHVYDKEGEDHVLAVNLRDMLYRYVFTTHILYEFELYAREHDIRIINMTSASLLDAFEFDKESKY